jgi:hypothetical protein
MRLLLWAVAATPLTLGLLWEANSEGHRKLPPWLQAVLVGWLCLAAALPLAD